MSKVSEPPFSPREELLRRISWLYNEIDILETQATEKSAIPIDMNCEDNTYCPYSTRSETESSTDVLISIYKSTLATEETELALVPDQAEADDTGPVLVRCTSADFTKAEKKLEYLISHEIRRLWYQRHPVIGRIRGQMIVVVYQLRNPERNGLGPWRALLQPPEKMDWRTSHCRFDAMNSRLDALRQMFETLRYARPQRAPAAHSIPIEELGFVDPDEENEAEENDDHDWGKEFGTAQAASTIAQGQHSEKEALESHPITDTPMEDATGEDHEPR